MEQQELARRLALLQQCAGLAAAGDEGRKALALRMQVFEYKRGAVLYYQKELAGYLYFNVVGQVELRFSFIPTADSSTLGLKKIQALSGQNKKYALITDTKVLKRIADNEPFGLQALAQDSYKTKATCKTNGVLYRLPAVYARALIAEASARPAQSRFMESVPLPSGRAQPLLTEVDGLQEQEVKQAEQQPERERQPAVRSQSTGRKTVYAFSRRTADNFDLVNTEIININNDCRQLRLFCNQSRTHSRSEQQPGLSSKHVNKVIQANSRARFQKYRTGSLERAAPPQQGLAGSLQVKSAQFRASQVGKRDVLFILRNLYNL